MSEGKDISRRDFLKNARNLVVSGIFLNKFPKQLLPSNIESEAKPIISQSIVVDLSPDKPTLGVEQKEFVDTTQIYDTLKTAGYPTLVDLTKSVPPEKPIGKDYDLYSYFYDNFQSLKEKYGDKLYPTMLFTLMMDEKKNHGLEVASALKQSEGYYGKQITPILYPSQSIYQNARFRPFTIKGDSWENHGFEITLNADIVIPLLQKAKSDSNVVHSIFNLSWQLGNQQVVFGEWGTESPRVSTIWSNTTGPNGEPLFYVFPNREFGPLDGKEKVINGKTYLVFPEGIKEIAKRNTTEDYYVPIDNTLALLAEPRDKAEQIYDHFEGLSEKELKDDSQINPVVNIEILDAYRTDAVPKSIQEVIKVAKAFPNDFIILAAGNEEDNLTNIPVLPNNIIIVGEWKDGSIKPTGSVYRAEIYVPNSKLKLGRGSSFSVPFISATIEKMLAQNIPFNEIKQRLQYGLSTKESYRVRENGDPNSIPTEANVISIDKLQNQLGLQF